MCKRKVGRMDYNYFFNVDANKPEMKYTAETRNEQWEGEKEYWFSEGGACVQRGYYREGTTRRK